MVWGPADILGASCPAPLLCASCARWIEGICDNMSVYIPMLRILNSCPSLAQTFNTGRAPFPFRLITAPCHNFTMSRSYFVSSCFPSSINATKMNPCSSMLETICTTHSSEATGATTTTRGQCLCFRSSFPVVKFSCSVAFYYNPSLSLWAKVSPKSDLNVPRNMTCSGDFALCSKLHETVNKPPRLTLTRNCCCSGRLGASTAN